MGEVHKTWANSAWLNCRKLLIRLPPRGRLDFRELLNTLNDLKAVKMFVFHCLSWILMFAADQPLQALANSGPASSQREPSAEILPQEQLLAELLAELPAERRTAMIARALSASRQSGKPAEAGTEKIRIEAVNSQTLPDLADQLASIRVLQQQQAAELAKLKDEAVELNRRMTELQSSSRREIAGRTGQGIQAFVLPRFQRVGPPSSYGPYVNQPSGPILTLRPVPEPETEQAIAMELAQLSRDMFRLNQRLQQLQSMPEGAASPVTTAPPADAGSSGQARQPSPLLPR